MEAIEAFGLSMYDVVHMIELEGRGISVGADSISARGLQEFSLNLDDDYVTVETVTRFAFDERNNRVLRTVTGDEESYAVAYTYDLNNRLLEKVRTGDEPAVTTFTYDRNGNQLTQTADGHTKTLIYDVFNHLVRVEREGMIAVYAYRADGLRVNKTVNGHTTTHVWDRGSIILELNGSGAVMNRFSRGVGHLIRSYHHGFYLFNARTDVVQRVDIDGSILHTYRYDAFGNQLSEDEVNTNPFRFAGEYYDFETGFIYLRARFYNPAIGRFISEDPHWTIRNMQFGDVPLMRHGRMLPNRLAIMQAGNLFLFALNNPVRFIDPSGLHVLDSLQDLGRGLRDGFVAHYQNLVHVVTNPVDTVVGIVDAFIDDPLGMYLQTTILSPMNPITGPLVIGHEIASADGAYETGFVIGGYLGQASTVAVGYGVGKGLGAAAKKIEPVIRSMTVDDILAGAVHTNTTRSGVQNWVSSTRGMDAARTHFDALNPTNVRTMSNGTIVGNLADGRAVNIHPGSSVGGAPTLEIFNRSTGVRIKIRY